MMTMMISVCRFKSYAEHILEITSKFPPAEDFFSSDPGDSLDESPLDRDWEFAVVTRALGSSLQDVTGFSVAFRELEFVQDFHAIPFTSKALETRMLNGYLLMKKALYDNLGI